METQPFAPLGRDYTILCPHESQAKRLATTYRRTDVPSDASDVRKVFQKAVAAGEG